jgi:hypothetical protein
MGEILFVLKTFLVTCLVVFCFQFKLGDKTVDQKINSFLQDGQLLGHLEDISSGATRLTASTYNSIKEGKIKSPLSKIEEAEEVKKAYEESEKLKREQLEAIEEL